MQLVFIRLETVVLNIQHNKAAKAATVGPCGDMGVPSEEGFPRYPLKALYTDKSRVSHKCLVSLVQRDIKSYPLHRFRGALDHEA